MEYRKSIPCQSVCFLLALMVSGVAFAQDPDEQPIVIRGKLIQADGTPPKVTGMNAFFVMVAPVAESDPESASVELSNKMLQSGAAASPETDGTFELELYRSVFPGKTQFVVAAAGLGGPGLGALQIDGKAVSFVINDETDDVIDLGTIQITED